MSDQKEDSIHYLTRWAGGILVLTILSIVGHCSMDTYLTKRYRPSDECAAQAGIVTLACLERMGMPQNERIQCMNAGAEMLNSCNDEDTENKEDFRK